MVDVGDADLAYAAFGIGSPVLRPLIFHAVDGVCCATKALGIDRAHLAGNSSGGGVAVRIAMTHQYERAPGFDQIVREFLQSGAAAAKSEE